MDLPDDPMRVDAPMGWTDEQERRYIERWNAMYDDIFSGVYAVLEGRQRLMRIGPHQYDEEELVELMIIQHPEITRLTPFLLDRVGLGRKLISKFAEELTDLYIETEGI